MALGDLCYKKGGTALAYKKGGSALVYKSEPSGDVTVRVPWSPQSYVCHTYDQYHEIAFVCSGRFTSGSGSIVSQVNGGTEVIFTLKITQGPAVFAVSTGISTPCSATEEDPGATCDILANQRGVTPMVKRSISAPRSESGKSATVTNISFNSSKKLTSIS